MTAATLRNYTCKDLAQMARREGVTGWHGMRKDELIDAIVRAGRRRSSKSVSKVAGGRSKASSQTGKNRKEPKASEPRPATTRRVPKRVENYQKRLSERKNLGTDPASSARDRLVVMVRDPYWLHAYWELASGSVERARSAMGHHWHTARPVLRLYQVNGDEGAKLEKVVEIHGGVNNWYLDVQEPPQDYQLEIGYASPGAAFYCLARSNRVQTPAPGTAELVDHNWTDVAENADQIFAMSGGYSPNGASAELQELLEERLRRRLGRPAQTRFGNGAATESRGNELRLAVDAELVVFGSTERHTHVTVQGEPVHVNADGSFAVKMHLPDRRQVIPIVAGSSDGVEQKTVILGVERNTKQLDSRGLERQA